MHASDTPRKVDSEAIFTTLREEILSGQHVSGTPFKEIPLAERFGVSRTPIRAVLTRLEQERLLVRADRGLQVPRADPERVIQVYDLRIQLEATAAAEAALARQLTDVLRLEALLARDRELTEPSDQQKKLSNLEFHEALWQASNNPVLIDLLARLSTHLNHSPKPTLSIRNRWQESLDEHEAIIAAITGRDQEGGRTLAAQHMSRAKQLRLELLRDHAINILGAPPQ